MDFYRVGASGGYDYLMRRVKVFLKDGHFVRVRLESPKIDSPPQDSGLGNAVGGYSMNV